MSVVLPPPAPSSMQLGRGRFRLIVAAMVLAVLVGAGGVALTFVERQYGPLAPGNFGGVVTMDSFSPTAIGEYRLTASSGQVMEALYNRGSRSITVTSMTSGFGVSQVQWSPFEFTPDVEVGPKGAHWQDFPATIPAHGVIRLLVTLQRPQNCPPVSDGIMVGYSPSHEVHWKSLFWSHTTTIDNASVDVNLC